MGRFDSLKGDGFTSSKYEKINTNDTNDTNGSSRRKNRNRNRNEKSKEPVVVVEKPVVENPVVVVENPVVENPVVVVENPVVVVENPVVVVEKPVVVVEKPLESEWIKRISIRKAKEKSVINLNDPKFWNGLKWTGPMFIRANKMSTDTETYLRNAEKSDCSLFIIPYNKPEYSRDEVNWYDSWEDTFTPNQWQSMNGYEDENIWDECFRRIDSLHEERREESNRHYEDTGELDDFAWAEAEAEKYEEYCIKFDEKYGDNRITNVEDFEDEYDEYDEYED